MNLRDALGFEIDSRIPARRVASLLPSETESVAALAGIETLVARTKWCVEPRGLVERVPACGGTKGADVEALIAIRPDLVLANQEENSKKDIERLRAAGLSVFVSFPKTAREAVRHLREIAILVGRDPESELIERCDDAIAEAEATQATNNPVRAFVPIWDEPLMSFNDDTFASDMLSLAGFENVFGDRKRRYPLRADIGDAPALDTTAITGRDTRYPRVTDHEVRARRPDVVLFPDEPYAFTTTHVERAGDRFGVRDATLIDGKLVFWSSTRIAHALPELRAFARDARSRSQSRSRP